MNMQFLPAAMSKQLSALLVSGVAFLTACGGTAATNPAPAVQPGDQQVTLMVGNSMQFMPGSIAVRAGQPIDLVLRNGAGIPHDFALAVGASSPVKIEAQGGQTANGTFTIETPGTYEFLCTVPGHAAAGMRGTLTAR